jgi:TPR repeat protein
VSQSLKPLLLATILGLSPTLALADFNDGVAAFVAGDLDKALSIFVPLAETSDHGYAQYFLGRMYADGRGVEKSAQEAAKWFRKAAEKGVKEAQFHLGGLYERGEGVPQDYEYAYAWFTVAEKLGNPRAGAARTTCAAKLDPEGLKEAEALAADLTAKYGRVAPGTSVDK